MKHIFQKNEVKNYIRRPILTKEHGSWAILVVPVITGIAESHKYNFVNMVFSTVCILFLFLSYVPVEILINKKVKKLPDDSKYNYAKFWFTIYSLIGLISGIYLVVILNRPILFLFALFAAFLFIISKLISFKFPKNAWGDLCAVAGLTLSAPAMIYILDGRLNSGSLFIWLANFIFFASSTIYVHMKIKASVLKKKNFSILDKISFGKVNLVFHSLAISLIVYYAFKFPAREIAVFAFLPMFIHAIAGTFRFKDKTNFKKLGFTLLAYSAVFTLILISFTK